MTDQATLLRGLVGRLHEPSAVLHDDPSLAARVGAPARPVVGKRATVLAITSGKGGVGKSVITLNLGVALARQGLRVCLLDAHAGLGNIDLMCGLNGYWNLTHVMNGAREVSEVILEGPAGVRVIPGAAALAEADNCPEEARRHILEQLMRLESNHDFLLIDAGAASRRESRRFVTAADRTIVVTTPEPTAIADAYVTIKSLCATPGLPDPLILVNQAENPLQGREVIDRIQRTCESFLQRRVESAGVLLHDPQVATSLRRCAPFVLHAPNAPATRGIEQLARLIGHLSITRNRRSYFGQVLYSTDRQAA